jgi:hypothetical protein
MAGEPARLAKPAFPHAIFPHPHPRLAPRPPRGGVFTKRDPALDAPAMASVPCLFRKTNAPQREESRLAPAVEVVAAKQLFPHHISVAGPNLPILLHLVFLGRAHGNRTQGALPALVRKERRADAVFAAVVPCHLPQDGILYCNADVLVMDQARATGALLVVPWD